MNDYFDFFDKIDEVYKCAKMFCEKYERMLERRNQQLQEENDRLRNAAPALGAHRQLPIGQINHILLDPSMLVVSYVY